MDVLHGKGSFFSLRTKRKTGNAFDTMKKEDETFKIVTFPSCRIITMKQAEWRIRSQD